MIEQVLHCNANTTRWYFLYLIIFCGFVTLNIQDIQDILPFILKQITVDNFCSPYVVCTCIGPKPLETFKNFEELQLLVLFTNGKRKICFIYFAE